MILREDGSYVDPSDPGERGPDSAPRVSITDDEGRLLAFLARGRRVLEIGTGLGVSTRYLASTAATVDTLDISEWVREHVWPTLPENVTPLAADEVTGMYDLAFIDGGHLPEEFAVDVALCRRVVDGLMVAHDATTMKLGAPWMLMGTTHGLGFLFT